MAGPSSTTIPVYMQKPIVRSVWNYIYGQGGNCFLGITGMPMKGKSHTAVKLAIQWKDGDIDLDDILVYKVEELLERTFSLIKVKGKPLSLEDFAKIDNMEEYLRENEKHIRIKPGNVIVFDEAGTGVYVREFFSQDNKTMSKILQVWRFLRMLVIIVVPGDFNIADSTISRFMNLEVIMKSIRRGKYAKAVAYEYIDWDSRKKKAIKRRLKGCRNGGFIKVEPLSGHWAEDYEKVSKIHKLMVLGNLGKEYVVQKQINIGKSKSILDDVNEVFKHPEIYKNDKDKWDWMLVKDYLQVSVNKAQRIITHIRRKEKQVNTHT